MRSMEFSSDPALLSDTENSSEALLRAFSLLPSADNVFSITVEESSTILK